MMLEREALTKMLEKYGVPVKDSVTGYALNIPLRLQSMDFVPGAPGYDEFVKRREAAGFHIDDNDVSL